ncbi:MAG TPA: hypothetical protein VL049_27815 [Candidatus Dormibacteraeota bacterium]|nr:hypothetical protein [Candidatus Dormibacteraeota bacterium]
MSEYLRVLTRLERESAASKPSGGRESANLTVLPAATSRPATPVAAPIGGEPGARFAALYDSLRATASGDPTRALVFASPEADGSARVIIDGLAAYVRRLGQRVCLAEVVTSASLPLLRVRLDGGDTDRATGNILPLDLRSHASADDVRGWLARVAQADLTLIDGGALAHSLEPALLACGCDGLLLVVHAEVTSREALRAAAERAAAVGCRTLGIVMQVDPQRLPPWQRSHLRAG